MLTEILHHADLFRTQISDLKSKAPMYPKVYFEDKGGCQWVTTMVEFNYNGVRYKRHHVESIVPNKNVGTNDLYNKLIDAAEMCIKMAIPCQFDEIIGLVNPDELKAVV